MDRISTEVRSRNMAAIRGTGNKTTELRFVGLLRKNKISGWRRHQNIFGHPDFIFHKKKIAVFIDGCFWHGCKRCKTIPKQNHAFWGRKISKNILRDKLVNKTLRDDGWKIIRVWEHELKNIDDNLPKKIESLQ